MAIVTVRAARARLSELIDRALAGEEIIIARGDQPVVRLEALERTTARRAPGTRRGAFTVADAFFESSGAEELPTSDAEDPGPRATARFPSDFDYQLLYFDVHLYARVEGGEIYTADDTREFYVITDERTIRERAGFRDDDREPITIRVFDAAAERDAYCVARYGARRGAEE